MSIISTKAKEIIKRLITIHGNERKLLLDEFVEVARKSTKVSNEICIAIWDLLYEVCSSVKVCYFNSFFLLKK